MSVPLWVAQLARSFWMAAGRSEAYPRELRRSIARALPVSIVLLARLRLDGVRAWLHDNGIACPCEERDRPLRACLVATRGHGLIFLDGTDPAEEQRFSLAHELAHFLRHYWQPRSRAVQRLGPEIAEVFDGERSPSHQERLHALLGNASLGCHLHLMRREPRSEVRNPTIQRAEAEADQLAFELLAPAGEVLARTRGGSAEVRRARAVELLEREFGLPREQAAQYAQLLLPPVREDPLLRRLRS